MKISNSEFNENCSEGSKKADYIASSLSKIKHKKWELYIISRIVHILNDPEIEFVCQQLVLRGNDKRALADLYFPQFNICLEINERGSHSRDKEKALDKARNTEIIKALGAELFKIENFTDDDEKITDASLEKIHAEVDEFVKNLRSRKEILMIKNEFQPWSMVKKFDPTPYIRKGYLDADENPSFRYITDALRCFGYSGGLYQKATWKAADWDHHIVWFPSFIPHRTWRNKLLDDQKTIIEELIDPALLQKHSEPLEQTHRFTFSKIRTPLGETAYRFLGEFKYDHEVKSPTSLQRRYTLVSKHVCL